MTPSLPSLFISHGAPDILLRRQASLDVLDELGKRLPEPRGIVIVSAHWSADPVGVTLGERLASMHDFSGFPNALNELAYPARGDDELSRSVLRALESQGISSAPVNDRGLDHGAWVPLTFMYPRAQIPVVQVSLPAGSLQDVAEMGRALAPLRDAGVLIIGSGGSVHNLRALRRDARADAWALEFEDWLNECVEDGRFDHLLDPHSYTEHFRQAHPTLEHYAPLLVAWAAAGTEQAGRRIHHSFDYANLGMSFFAFGGVEHRVAR
jgi:4,5-DOPA dioxygenase extradiol